MTDTDKLKRLAEEYSDCEFIGVNPKAILALIAQNEALKEERHRGRFILTARKWFRRRYYSHDDGYGHVFVTKRRGEARSFVRIEEAETKRLLWERDAKLRGRA